MVKLRTAMIKKLKKVSSWYWLVAILLHLIPLIIFGHRMMFPGAVRDVLFKGKIEARPEEIAPSRVEPGEKRVITEVPAHIRRAPEVKEIVIAKKPLEARDFARIATVEPKEIKLAERRKIKAERVLDERRAERRQTWRQFAGQFRVSGRERSVRAVFTPALAQYSYGNWNLNPAALPNLMREVNRRSNIKATEVPQIVRVSSKEIFKYPFVYFTGTEDFRLTEEEVKNLRLYLMQGGLIWADNGLPGRGSRFDIAFRREVRRVFPDRDFEAISEEHGLFTSFYRIRELPKGMNWKDDPLEVIKIDRRVVIIYTLNGYGNLWETRFTEDGEIDTSLDENFQPLWGRFMEGNIGVRHLGYTRYENLEQESIEASYQLGVNIIAYLLTR